MRSISIPALASALLLALPLFGCAAPDLGKAPFLCNPGTPKCPSGYVCQSQTDVCVKAGTTFTPPQKDSGPPPKDDAKAPTPDEGIIKPDTPAPPPGTSVVITEFMANPNKVTDSAGEYIELFNVGNQPVDINGWTLKDLGSDSHTIAAGGSLMVPPRGYLLLGASATKATNGNIAVAYAYKLFFLSNKADEIQLLDTNGKIVDQLAYDTAAGWTITDGASLSVKNPFADKTKATNWCTETAAWSGSAGDFGTPGGNPKCQ